MALLMYLRVREGLLRLFDVCLRFTFVGVTRFIPAMQDPNAATSARDRGGNKNILHAFFFRYVRAPGEADAVHEEDAIRQWHLLRHEARHTCVPSSSLKDACPKLFKRHSVIHVPAPS